MNSRKVIEHAPVWRYSINITDKIYPKFMFRKTNFSVFYFLILLKFNMFHLFNFYTYLFKADR